MTGLLNKQSSMQLHLTGAPSFLCSFEIGWQKLDGLRQRDAKFRYRTGIALQISPSSHHSAWHRLKSLFRMHALCSRQVPIGVATELETCSL